METDEDLFEVRQSDAFYAASPDYGDTATLNWMPTAPTDYAEPGAESFDDIVARVHRVQERLLARAADDSIVAVSHHGFLHFFLGVALFGAAFTPAHAPRSTRRGTPTPGSRSSSTASTATWTGSTSRAGCSRPGTTRAICSSVFRSLV